MGKKLTLYLINGNPFGPRTVEIGSWSGKALFVPRHLIGESLKERPEFDNPGIYCLKSEAEDDAYEERVYIGEADNLRDRLRNHLRNPNRDFSELVCFMSKDELLTKAHVKYLEARLISLAQQAKSAELENAQNANLPRLHEADISDMEYFLEQIQLILPVLGFDFLKPSTTDVAERTKLRAMEASLEKEPRRWVFKSNKYEAYMLETEEGFVVLKGSVASLKTRKSFSRGSQKLRKKLLETGALLPQSDGLLFQEDVVFSSLSAAAVMIMGSSVAGPLYWLDEKGRTYKEVQELEEL